MTHSLRESDCNRNNHSQNIVNYPNVNPLSVDTQTSNVTLTPQLQHIHKFYDAHIKAVHRGYQKQIV